MSQFTVHLYGPPAAGKTVLLTALNRFLPVERDELLDVVRSGPLNTQYERVLRGQFPEGTRPKTDLPSGDAAEEAQEVMSYRFGRGPAKDLTVTIVAHAGEDLLSEERGFVRQFANQPSKLLVVVLNPFKSNVELGGKALRSLIVTLQARLSLSFPEAFYRAVEALFRLDPAEQMVQEFAPALHALLSAEGQRIQLDYDPEEPTEERRFSWSGVGPDVVGQLEAQFRRFVEVVVEHHRRYWDPLRQAAYQLDNCIVVLSHIDVTDLMPAVTATDFDEVLHETFRGKPERLASQQLLAKMHRLSVGGEGSGGVRPWQLLDSSVLRLHDYIAAFAARSADELVVQEEDTGGELSASQHAGLFTAFAFPWLVLALVVHWTLKSVGGAAPLLLERKLMLLLGGVLGLALVGLASGAVARWFGRRWLRYLQPGRLGARFLADATEVVELKPSRLELWYSKFLGRMLNVGYVQDAAADERFLVSDLRSFLTAWPTEKAAGKKKKKKRGKKREEEAADGGEPAEAPPGVVHRPQWVLDAAVGLSLLVALVYLFLV